MTCVLCGVAVDLFDLDDQGWCGDPAHRTCAEAARSYAAQAIDEIAAAHRARNERAGRRYRVAS